MISFDLRDFIIIIIVDVVHILTLFNTKFQEKKITIWIKSL